ncbi:MAG: pyridoxamine 5'-phosphate oxidase family protein [Myxococcota bacterium]
MGRAYEALDDRLTDFIRRQHVFFVATAPLAGEGHVNVSPKGLDSLRVLGPHTVAYVDLVGSGAETIAHLRDNGRITLMFCAFEGPPKILRLYGRGEVLEPGDEGFDALLPLFPEYDAVRAILRVDVTRITDSCGYGVPLYTFEGDRRQLHDWADRKGPERLRRYQLEKNTESIDGLPALIARTLRR